MAHNTNPKCYKTIDKMKSAPRKHMTDEQKDVMVSFMEFHGDISGSNFSLPQGRQKKTKLMNQLTIELNRCKNGVVRTPKDWLKVWNNFKTRVKTKAANIFRNMKNTGGDPPLNVLALTSWEKRIFSLISTIDKISTELIVGHGIIEAGIEEGLLIPSAASFSNSDESLQNCVFHVELSESDLETGSSHQINSMYDVVVADHEYAKEISTSTSTISESYRRQRKRSLREPQQKSGSISQTRLQQFIKNEEGSNKDRLSADNNHLEGQQIVADALKEGMQIISNVQLETTNVVRDGLQAVADSQNNIAKALMKLADVLKNTK